MISTHQNGSTITLMLSARAINPFDQQFRRTLDTAIAQVEAQRAQLNGVIVGFNADPAASQELEQLMALTPAQAADCLSALGEYNALLRRLDNLGMPVIATLSEGEVSGHALGLALACHRRIALQDSTFSMPQVRQGLAPLAGEIARTVRLTGMQAAIPLLVEGATWSAAQAREAGLLHSVAADDTELAEQVHAVVAAESARRRIAQGTPDSSPAAATAPAMQQPWDAKGYKLPGGALNSPALQTLLQVAPAMLREKTGGHYPAPEAILCAMVEGLQVDFDSALLIESRYFCQTAIHPVARNLMRVSQLRSDPAYAGVAEFSAAVRAAYDDEIRQLRADGVSNALLRNAARAAGMGKLPPADADAGAAAAAATPASLPLPAVRDRLLYAQAIAALASVGRGVPDSVDDADLASIAACGFPSYTGGAIAFARHIGLGAFARRAAELGVRFSLPPRWEDIASQQQSHPTLSNVK